MTTAFQSNAFQISPLAFQIDVTTTTTADGGSESGHEAGHRHRHILSTAQLQAIRAHWDWQDEQDRREVAAQQRKQLEIEQRTKREEQSRQLIELQQQIEKLDADHDDAIKRDADQAQRDYARLYACISELTEQIESALEARIADLAKHAEKMAARQHDDDEAMTIVLATLH